MEQQYLYSSIHATQTRRGKDYVGDFDEWRQLKKIHNLFKFWDLTLEIQLSVIVFVRSLHLPLGSLMRVHIAGAWPCQVLQSVILST